MAAPSGRHSRTQPKERAGALQQIAWLGPAQVCRTVEAARTAAVLIAEFPVRGARR